MRKRLRRVKVLCLMRAKDHLKIFSGTNILHNKMLVLLGVNFNTKLILVKIRKIMSLNKLKTLQQRAKTNLIWKLSPFSEHLNLKQVIIKKKIIFKILFKLKIVYKQITNSIWLINLNWFLKEINNFKSKMMKLRQNY